MANDLIKLSKALEDLRSELSTAQKEGVGKDIKFEIQEISLDLQIVATGEVSGEGNVGWGIFSAKAGARASDAATHKISLKLKVTASSESDGERSPLEVSDADAAPK